MKNYFLFFFIVVFSLITRVAAQTVDYAGYMKNYDVKHYNLDLQISNKSSGISGNVIITSSVIATKLDTFVIELIDTIAVNYTLMVVDSVKINSIIHTFLHKNDLIIIPLINSINQGQIFSAQIYYHGIGTPIDYKTNGNGIVVTNDNTQSFTMSEPKWSKVWWPCKQDLTDKSDSVTFYITTDSKNKSGSNGLLKSTQYLQNGKVKYKWETKYPIDYYLISFVVGPFDEYVTYAPLQSSNDSVKIQSLLNKNSPYYLKNIKAIEVTKNLISIYSELLGDYPFKNEKYGYCAVDAPIGAMEHQTMTTINSSLLDPIVGTYSWVIAHELAHHWFGDYVTCKTWNDIWINEGFATYLEYVALQKLHLDSIAKIWMNTTHSLALTIERSSIYVPDSSLNDDNRIFNFSLTYKKGASILHTLRYEINNDSLFFKGLKDFLSKYSYSVAGAVDFKNTMELTTGLDLTDFFDQWYYGVGYPLFKINWYQNNDTLTIKSVQSTTYSKPALFKTHFDIKLKYLSSDSIIRLYQNTNNQIFKIPIKAKISTIELDPDDWILKRFERSTSVKNYKADNSNFINVYPNPFNESINFKFYLYKLQPVKIDIFNANGIIIETKIINGVEGENLSVLDISVNKGIYFYRITTNGTIQTGKLIKL
jgi:aminopeptidase N